MSEPIIQRIILLLPDKVLKKEKIQMAKATSTQNCPRQPQPKEIARRCAGFDPDENVLLTLIRFFCGILCDASYAKLDAVN